MEWFQKREAFFHATWSFYANGCKERMQDIRHRVGRNTDFIAHIKDQKAASFFQLLTRNSRSLRPRSTPLSTSNTNSTIALGTAPHDAIPEIIYKEFVQCFHDESPLGKFSKARQRRKRKPRFRRFTSKEELEKLDAEQAAVEEQLRRSTNPYAVEDLTKKLTDLKLKRNQFPSSIILFSASSLGEQFKSKRSRKEAKTASTQKTKLTKKNDKKRSRLVAAKYLKSYSCLDLKSYEKMIYDDDIDKENIRERTLFKYDHGFGRRIKPKEFLASKSSLGDSKSMQSQPSINMKSPRDPNANSSNSILTENQWFSDYAHRKKGWLNRIRDIASPDEAQPHKPAIKVDHKISKPRVQNLLHQDKLDEMDLQEQRAKAALLTPQPDTPPDVSSHLSILKKYEKELFSPAERSILSCASPPSFKPLLISDLVAEYKRTHSLEIYFNTLYPGLWDSVMDNIKKHFSDKEPTKATIEPAAQRQPPPPQKPRRRKRPPTRPPETICNVQTCCICECFQRAPEADADYMRYMKHKRQKLELRSYYARSIMRQCLIQKHTELESMKRECQELEHKKHQAVDESMAMERESKHSYTRALLLGCYQALQICQHIVEQKMRQRNMQHDRHNAIAQF
ncbi:uncharacterized protein LOC115633813 [Scaptodrosophila lebanonensis]|uniref:Uncharacterized protein LOC115633813 n=1 Tax=Drosophila lebanonensis TaxID=7225 RepID=A0A6J2UIW2_DROLE|nr:uncharacterized protein LOC115633813 [Scaptodrosophila lebanonensis]